VPAGGCSLREAIIYANNNPGLDIIKLQFGTTYQLSLAAAGNDDATTGDLNITDDVQFGFTGTCSHIILCYALIEGGNGWSDRLINIGPGVTVSMLSLWLENGHSPDYGGAVFLDTGATLTMTSGLVDSNSAQRGGGIYNNDGSLYLVGSVISNNSAPNLSGGGISSQGGNSSLVMTNTLVTGNVALMDGGGIEASGATQISNSTLTLNRAFGDVGALEVGGGAGLYYSGPGMALLSNMTITSNTVSPTGYGGGVLAHNGSVSLVDSTLGWNYGPCGGGLGAYGGIANVQVADSTFQYNRAEFGAGVCAEASALISITNSTLTANLASQNGGGVNASAIGLYNDTISQNVADSDHNGSGDGGGLYIDGAGPVVLANSILAGNVDTGGGAGECNGLTLTSLGYNLIQGGNNCAIIGSTTGNRLGVDPGLGPLAGNGGPTLTQALLGISPAVNHGNPAGCRDGAGTLLTTDQRGLPRKGTCDIGAFELQNVLWLPLVRRS